MDVASGQPNDCRSISYQTTAVVSIRHVIPDSRRHADPVKPVARIGLMTFRSVASHLLLLFEKLEWQGPNGIFSIETSQHGEGRACARRLALVCRPVYGAELLPGRCDIRIAPAQNGCSGT
jgi:hypothetical protein